MRALSVNSTNLNWTQLTPTKQKPFRTQDFVLYVMLERRKEELPGGQMLRLLRAIGRRRNQSEPKQIGTPLLKPQEHRVDMHITSDMARKLFGFENAPEPSEVPEPLELADPMPTTPEHVRYAAPEPPEKPDPFERVRRSAEAEPRFRALLEATKGDVRRHLRKPYRSRGPPNRTCRS